LHKKVRVHSLELLSGCGERGEKKIRKTFSDDECPVSEKKKKKEKKKKEELWCGFQTSSSFSTSLVADGRMDDS
jgi:hypothetical protein